MVLHYCLFVTCSYIITCCVIRESTGRSVRVARLQCKYHPECELLEDFHAGDLICPECGLVVGDRFIQSCIVLYNYLRNIGDMYDLCHIFEFVRIPNGV